LNPGLECTVDRRIYETAAAPPAGFVARELQTRPSTSIAERRLLSPRREIANGFIRRMEMDEQALENGSGPTNYADGAASGADEVTSAAIRPRFSDPEAWHDLAERGTPRSG
jgi:hypothetical protein